jgi:hypothetical protein
MHRYLSLAVAIALLSGGGAAAECRIATPGARCLTVAPRAAPLQAGDALPEGARLVFNPRYWGLPSVGDGQRFYVVGREVYRVDAATMTVIERVFGANPAIFR